MVCTAAPQTHSFNLSKVEFSSKDRWETYLWQFGRQLHGQYHLVSMFICGQCDVGTTEGLNERQK